MINNSSFIVCLLLILLSVEAPGQEIKSINFDSLQFSTDLKIGLVLSGGGAKGFAHIGVLKMLEETGIQVDYITGTSMGSVIGGLYAAGYSAAELDSLARTLKWQQLFSEQTQRRFLTTYAKKKNEKFLLNFPVTENGIGLPRGLISGQNVYELLSDLTKNVHTIRDFDQLSIPFRAIATNLETGKAEVLGGPHLPDAIRASISIPSIFVPYKMNGNIYVDGGIVRNLPVSDVIDMGANFVIAVDVGEPLKKFDELDSMLEILNQTVLFHASQENSRQESLSDITIAPPLDTLKQYQISDFSKAVEILEMGERMARPYRKTLAKIAAVQKRNSIPGTLLFEDDPTYYISSIEIEGTENLDPDFVRTELKLDTSNPVRLSEINRAINQLYGSGFFETISYSVESNPSGSVLKLRIREQNINTVSAGLRFDTERDAAVIFHTTLQNLFKTSSLTQANVRLGERIFTNLEFLSTPGNRPRFGIKADISYLRDDIEWFDNEERISSFKSHNYRLDLFGGLVFSNTFELGIGIRQDFFNMSQELNTNLLPFDDQNFHSVYGRFWLDTYDQLHFPTSGQSILIEYNVAESFLQTSSDFTRQLVYGDWIFPAGNKISFNTTLFAGRTTGSEIPQPYWFNFMLIDRNLRTDRFVGYEDDEDAAKNLYMLGAGIQYQLDFNKFIILSGNVGNRFNKWTADKLTETNLSGLGLGIGANTIVGAVKLTASYSERNDLFVRFDIGFRF